jgi:hypothetical protein
MGGGGGGELTSFTFDRLFTSEQIMSRNRINSISIVREEFDDPLLFVKLNYGSLGHLTPLFQLKGIYSVSHSLPNPAFL